MKDNENNKKKLIHIFKENVQGKKPNTKKYNTKHNGRGGHWLEQQFGIKANGNNKPDILGYELKNETNGVTTFGDWSGNYYIFKKNKENDYWSYFKGKKNTERQDSFCTIFGKPNHKKDNRFSWSGEPIPKYNCYNNYGQILLIDEKEDITIEYSFSKDKRPNKANIVPKCLQKENLVLVKWYGNSLPKNKKCRKNEKCLKQKLEDKFNENGWFTCKKDDKGIYTTICFGPPITWEVWLKWVKKGIVYFDSGMYQGNKRPYSQWRAKNTHWDSLIIEQYPE